MSQGAKCLKTSKLHTTPKVLGNSRNIDFNFDLLLLHDALSELIQPYTVNQPVGYLDWAI